MNKKFELFTFIFILFYFFRSVKKKNGQRDFAHPHPLEHSDRILSRNFCQYRKFSIKKNSKQSFILYFYISIPL